MAGAAVKRLADEAYSDMTIDLRKMREDGLSFGRIAKELNASGDTTRSGKPWNPVQVRRVLLRGLALRH